MVTEKKAAALCAAEIIFSVLQEVDYDSIVEFFGQETGLEDEILWHIALVAQRAEKGIL